MSEQEALEIARKNGYGEDVMQAILSGLTPEEALEQFGCLPDLYDLTPELATEEEIDIMLDQDFLYENEEF